MQNGNPGGSNQESARATTSATKRSLNSKVTTSLYTHEQHVDENVEPVMSHVQPNVYNEPMFNRPLEHPSQFYINAPQPQLRPFSLSYLMVKDLRTNYEVPDLDSVLDGDLDGFILSYLSALMDKDEDTL
ncbi:hypothetical protein GIB67_025225 [Kingdonia uniflora]|uniref:Uncharacterized protein n=1 Tax=Kingdonia uniflora TaxID=39325 RepID=A0A7J7NYV0_9MAGN|nr:hypothetical protein GIB67_025225 [Kingdonia uniflora]